MCSCQLEISCLGCTYQAVALSSGRVVATLGHGGCLQPSAPATRTWGPVARTRGPDGQLMVAQVTRKAP